MTLEFVGGIVFGWWWTCLLGYYVGRKLWQRYEDDLWKRCYERYEAPARDRALLEDLFKEMTKQGLGREVPLVTIKQMTSNKMGHSRSTSDPIKFAESTL